MRTVLVNRYSDEWNTLTKDGLKALPEYGYVAYPDRSNGQFEKIKYKLNE